jgi:spore cortex formation protein SpoVR/YcgB (stage V sporulation)
MSAKQKDDIEMCENQEEDIYEVEAILDKKKVGSIWKYKVKWTGYSLEDSTWEPLANLTNVPELLEEFESRWQNGAQQPEEKKKKEKSSLPSQPKQKKKLKSLYESALAESKKDDVKGKKPGNLLFINIIY